MAAITAENIGRDGCAKRATSLIRVSRHRWHHLGRPAASVGGARLGINCRSATLRGWLGGLAAPAPAHDTTSGGWLVKRYSRRASAQSPVQRGAVDVARHGV